MKDDSSILVRIFSEDVLISLNMLLTESEVDNYLKIPGVTQYLQKLKNHRNSAKKVTGELAMAIYSDASQSPRVLRYKDAYYIANQLVAYAQIHPKILSKNN